MRFALTFDPQGAGRAVCDAALRRGHEASALRADVGYVRTCTFPPWRALGLASLAALHAEGIPSVPSYTDGQFYDDKRVQARLLAAWSPKTYVVTDRTQLPEMSYPFVSKSAEGSASKNVRFIQSAEQADAEVAAVFGLGLRISGGTQRGYLIWQEFIAGNGHDVRVVVNGDRMYGLLRGNRDSVPFASGSGRLTVIRDLADPLVASAFALGDIIATSIDSRWCCFDFVFRDGVPLVLEISCSWSEKAYAECVVFDRGSLEPTGETAAQWADFAVDEMERLIA